jgi:hypothetical protein
LVDTFAVRSLVPSSCPGVSRDGDGSSHEFVRYDPIKSTDQSWQQSKRAVPLPDNQMVDAFVALAANRDNGIVYGISRVRCGT